MILLAVVIVGSVALAAYLLLKRRASGGATGLAKPLIEPTFDLEQAEASLLAVQRKAHEVAAYVAKTPSKKHQKKEASKFAKQLSVTKKQIKAMKDKEIALSKQIDSVVDDISEALAPPA